MPDFLTNLPGEELIRPGLSEFTKGETTIGSCLVRIIAPALTEAGLLSHMPEISLREADEITLYRILRRTTEDAYSLYNSYLRRVDLFQSALYQRMRQQQRELPSTL